MTTSIYEEIADFMRSTVGGRDLPRDVIIARARERWPHPEEARAAFEAVKLIATLPGAIYYEPVDLAISRQKQRALKK